MNSTSPKPSSSPSAPSSSFKPSDIPRRTMDNVGMTPRKPDSYGALATPISQTTTPALPEQRRLIVGREISLSGEIGSCDVLIVEGTVEAKLRNGRSIEIAQNGLFKGSVEIDEADIGGRFEGDLTVRNRLTVRSSGKVIGSIKYGELAVEVGGQLVGDVQILNGATPFTPASSSLTAAEAVVAKTE